MSFTIVLALTAAFFTAVLLLIELGRRLGMRGGYGHAGQTVPGIGPIEASVFGLLGLLIAFTFSGAAERLDARRALITDEANAMSTVWLRLDLLPTAQAEAIRPIFQRYVDSRIDYYGDVFDPARREAGDRMVSAIQQELWQRSTAAVSLMPAPSLGNIVLQAMNEMFDIATTRNSALAMHPPYIVYAMLVLLAFISALLIGFGMAAAKTRLWLHSVGYALVMTATLYVIVDFEMPRAGAIRVDGFDKLIIQFRRSL